MKGKKVLVPVRVSARHNHQSSLLPKNLYKPCHLESLFPLATDQLPSILLQRSKYLQKLSPEDFTTKIDSNLVQLKSEKYGKHTHALIVTKHTSESKVEKLLLNYPRLVCVKATRSSLIKLLSLLTWINFVMASIGRCGPLCRSRASLAAAVTHSRWWWATLLESIKFWGLLIPLWTLVALS